MNRFEEMPNRRGPSRNHGRVLGSVLLLAAGLHLSAMTAPAQVTNAFGFQGHLKLNKSAANGIFDFKFYLYEINDPLATPISVAVVTNVEVTDGLFVLEIDFGQSWDGSDRWMQICVQETGAGGDMTCLAQLHKLTHVPTSVYSVNSGLLNNLQSTDFVRSNCRICIGWADSNGGSPTEQQCHDLSRNGIDTGNRLQFDGNVDDNDRLWLWVECP